MGFIECRNVSVSFGKERVLRDVTMSVPKGAFLPVVGANGSGKTTLLRTIVGLVRPERGEVVTPFSESRPGYVPQHRAVDPLYPVSLEEIVAMGLYPSLGPWRRPGREERRRVVRLIDRFGLSAHGRRTFGELSGGMKQKALIARALAGRPEVLVMDEPTSELDAGSERAVLSLLLEMSAAGKTILMAHHGAARLGIDAPLVCEVERGRVRLVQARAGEGGRP